MIPRNVLIRLIAILAGVFAIVIDRAANASDTGRSQLAVKRLEGFERR